MSRKQEMERLETILKRCDAPDLARYLGAAGRAALEAGRRLKDLYEKPHRVTHKGEIDLVTEADLASEEAAIGVCSKEVPEADVLAEESSSGYGGLPLGLTWVIDPLDGTTNFAHGFPWFCVSIAMVGRGGVLAGVIYAPIQEELFCAARGCGAFLNARPIRVSREARLPEALLATGFPYDVRRRPGPVMAALGDMIVRAQGIRRAGAAAMDLAYVACGRLDGFWEVKLKPWDTAAGQLLVEEAGGTVTDFKGGGYTPFVPEILASNGRIHGEMVSILAPYGA